MKNEKVNEIREQLKINKKEWTTLYDVDSILLRDGIGVYPNWKFTRFLFSENEIFIKHGTSEPYGGRLSPKFVISSTGRFMNFQYGPVLSPVSYHRDFRDPKAGDIVVFSDGSTIVGECLIKNIIYSSNGTVIEFVNAAPMRNDLLASFYDPKEYDESKCIHGNIFPGVYLKFTENQNGHFNKTFGRYHEVIKYKNIESFNLKLISKKIFNTK